MSAPARDVQGTMFPDIAPERPQGWIMPSVFRGDNADLIAAVAPMYLTGDVMDATYGEGGWWRRFQPNSFVGHDIDPAKGDGVDCTALPEAADTYDAVTFDPPYIPAGGYETSTVQEFHDGFGLRQQARPDLWKMIEHGLEECARVLRDDGYLLVKCCDFVSSGQFWIWHYEILKHAETIGLRCHDLIVHHTGSGPGGWNIYTPIRARRHHSYLLVFTKAAS